MKLKREISLTHIHEVVVHSFNGDHFHEVVLVVSFLRRLRAAGVVFEEVVEELEESGLNGKDSSRYEGPRELGLCVVNV